jgi:MYXO-CTERM domain-containing protein
MIPMFALGLWSAPALANGRFPAADQILVDPSDPTHFALRATFGLLQSADGGHSWTWICEGAVGYTGDPALALLGGGNLLAGFFGSVAVSGDGGCGWGVQMLDTQHQYAFDATLDPADPSRAWVLTVSVDGTRQVSLLSVDSTGAIGTTLAVGQGFVPSTVEVAPSDPQRIYVTGAVENEPSIVLRSEDGGHNWSRFPFDTYGSLPLFISAIDPVDPNLLYARIDNQPGAPSTPTQRQPTDHLLVSRDGGETWQTVFSLDGDLYGFALSPDGSQIATGGPDLGVYMARTSDLDFQPVPAPVRGLRCLRWTSDGLLACGQEALDGWTVGRTQNDGQSFEPLFNVQNLTPLECPPSSTTGAACASVWPDIAPSIGAKYDTPSMPLGMLPPDSEPEAPAKSKDSGCSMTPQQPGETSSGGWALAAALTALTRRRRGAR